jgi:RHS repeat-associated protein
MTTSKQYDFLNRLTAIASQANGAGVMPISFNYSYNSANQRTKDTQADGSHWIYGYDSLGQVTNGNKYFSDNTLVPGQQFNYTFDTIGNRNQTKAGGDQNGANQRLANYAVNTLNQITSRDYPGTNDVVGVALTTNSVTVNGAAAFHKWEYYWGTVSTNNLGSAEWQQVSVSSGGSTSTGGLYVPKTREQFAYDLDGNLLSDGRWNYTWDAENRLVAMTNNTGVGPLYGLTFTYDAKGRRIEKSVTTNGMAFATQNFLYDGWNPIAILNSQSSILTAFTWGNDLSGSLQGAGGVGGLLAVSYRGTATTNCFVAYDGNGNVAGLINAANGTLVANYEYGPFGEVIRQTGPMAKANPIRFSTKYQDDEGDLLYYGYRYYKASMGTWVNRDPLGDWMFLRVQMQGKPSSVREHLKEAAWQPSYLFVKNNPESKVDWLGLDSEADISWAPAPCPNGQGTIYIQVLYGGIGPYSGPRVDDGSAGFFGGGSKGCPNYKTASTSPDVFQDSPGGLTGPVEFIVCRVCTKPCCAGVKIINGVNGPNGSYPISGYSIASVGPCVHWKKGDKGDLSDANTFQTFPGAPQAWTDGMNSDYPGVAGGKCTPNCGN